MGNSAIPIDLDALETVESEIDPAAVSTVIGDPFARYTIVALHGRATISLDHMAEVVVGFDAVGRETIAGPPARDRVRVRLHHVTLPKLDELGYLSYDHGAGAVANEGVPGAIYEVLGVEV